MKPKYGSLCSGIGGLDLAVEAVLDVEPAWFCEKEPAARKVLERHWPGVRIYEDIRATDWDSVEPIDVLVAGYPCQGFSQAGKRKGEKDPRYLWPEVYDALCILRPRVAIFENVRGHLTLGFERVLADLAEAGFDAEWGVFRASDVGACHQRARLFIVATNTRISGARGDSGGAFGQEEQNRWSEQNEGYTPQHLREDTSNSYRSTGGQQGGASEEVRESGAIQRFRRRYSLDWGEYEPAIQRHEELIGRPSPSPVSGENLRLSVDFVEWMMAFPEGWVQGLTRTAALKALGNAVVPLQAEYALSELIGE